MAGRGGADGMNWFYRFNLVCSPRRTVKNGFADIVWSSVRLQFCISKTAVNKILGMKKNDRKVASAVFVGRQRTYFERQMPLPPTRVFTKVKTRIKTLGTKHPLRRTNPGFLGDGGRDKLGSTGIVWFAVRYKFAVGKLA